MQYRYFISLIATIVFSACGQNLVTQQAKPIHTKTISATEVESLSTMGKSSSDSAQKVIHEVADASSLIAKNQTIVLQKNGDLTGTGTHNTIVVIDNDDDIKSRTLLILEANGAGVLHVVKSAENAVPCADCGALEVRLEDIFLENKGFRIKVSGGARNKEENEYSFRYSKIDDTWQLVKVVLISTDTMNPKNNRKITKTPKDFGKVDISTFCLEDYSK